MVEQHRDEKAIFKVAFNIESTEARDEYLRHVCGDQPELLQRVQTLLRGHDEAQSFLESPASGLMATAHIPSQPSSKIPSHFSSQLEGPGTCIGPYKLRELLGEGGMGAVYVAEQEKPLRRKVAVKVIKPGMDSRDVISRFEAERQALALMDHANIAKVLDAGTSAAGRPYFVMELVKGLTITEHCDKHKLVTRQRLELFLQVCQAVQHAHQKGIIHRDLKPSNVIVTMHDTIPVVKVIDFGVAKAIGQQLTEHTLYTGFSQMIGTPLYMSPEQAGQSSIDIDTRSDIYSLGVMLYELLTGCTPFESETLKRVGFDEMRRMIREVDPPRPSARVSTLNAEALSTIAEHRQAEPRKFVHVLLGELDWIVMKAMEKERNRRYETANGLSMDIQRFLAGEAVQAVPPSRAYLLSKFVRRHRGPIIVASLLLLSMLAGIIGTSYGLWQARQAATAEGLAKAEAQRKQSEAEQERSRAEQRELDAIDAVRKFGDAVAQNIELKNSPQLDGLRKSLLKEPFQFFQSLRERMQSDGNQRPETLARLAKVASDLGELTNEIGDKQDALRAHREALAIWEQLARKNPAIIQNQSELANSYIKVGKLLRETSERAEAQAAFEKARAILEALVLASPSVADYEIVLSQAISYIGMGLQTNGKPADALAAYEHGLAIRERLARENPNVAEFQSQVAGSHMWIGALHSENGKPTEGITAFEQARLIHERLVKENPSESRFEVDLAWSLDAIATALRRADKLKEALEHLERARVIRERLAGDYPTNTAFQRGLMTSYINLGILEGRSGKPTEALAAFEKARAIAERRARENPTVPSFKGDLAISHNNVGTQLSVLGKHAESLAAFEQARAIQEQLVREYPSDTKFQSDLTLSLNNIGKQLRDLGKPNESLAAIEQALAIRERIVRENPSNTEFQDDLTNSRNNFGLALMELGKLEEAVGVFREAMRTTTDKPGTLNLLGNVLRKQGKFEEAIAAYRESAQLDPKSVPPHFNLSWLFFEQGKYQEALDVYRDAIRIEPSSPWFKIHLARLICFTPDPKFRDTEQALDLATKAVNLEPDSAFVIGSLGMAQYRVSQFAPAVESLDKSIKRMEDDVSLSFRFFLAMAHWQLGQKDEARQQFDKSVELMEQMAEANSTLKLIHTEAAELLGIPDKPT